MYKMNRLYCFLLLVGALGMASCSSDDPLSQDEYVALYGKGANGVNGQRTTEGYVLRASNVEPAIAMPQVPTIWKV